VLRHKGAKHMKSAGADLKWFQLNLLDVYAAILTPLVLLIWLCLKCVCCGKKATPAAAKSQNKSKKNN